MRTTTERLRLRDQRGFTLIEVMVATTILAVGILGTVASVSSYRANASRSVGRETATHRAEQEIEALRSAGYKALVLKASPGTSTNPKDPRFNVTAGTPPTFRPSASVPAQPLVIDATDIDALDPSTTWQTGTIAGTIYRFITKDPSGANCVQICPRRLTVAVTIERTGAIVSSVVMSTLVADPQDVGADENATPAPTTPQCPCWNTLYAYDTPASFSSRQDPTDHVKRQWDDHPDLLGYDPPPTNADGTDPPLRKYTTDLGAVVPNGDAGYPGGRVIKQSGGCDSDANPDKTMRWTTPPVTTATTLTGDASFTIYTQTAGGGTGLGWLCLTAYDWKVDATGKTSSVTKLKSFGCSQNPWPTTPEPITCTGRFLDVGQTRSLAIGRSLGIELTVYDASTLDAVIVYDHPDYPSAFSWASTPSMMP